MGKFVCFEGIDGSGKTTVAKLASELINDEYPGQAFLLEKKNISYESEYLTSIMADFKRVLWRAGTGNPVHEVTDHGWLFLHAAWYTVLAENALPRKQGEHRFVIMDGWYYKIMSRFYAKKDFDKSLVDLVFSHLPKGDVVFFLDASPEQCIARKSEFTDAEIGANERMLGKPKDRFIDYQGEVYRAYTDISKSRGWNILDAASNNAELVARKAVDILLERM